MLELLRIIREDDPPRPSRTVATLETAACRGLAPRPLSHALASDLDWIVMKSIEKDRMRRYETANGLVLRPPPLPGRRTGHWPARLPPFYRFRKLARRHRTALAAFVLVALTFVAAAAVSTWQAIRAPSMPVPTPIRRAAERRAGPLLCRHPARPAGRGGPFRPGRVAPRGTSPARGSPMAGTGSGMISRPRTLNS